MGMVPLDLLTRARYGCVTDVAPSGIPSTKAAPMTWCRVITCPSFYHLAQATSHRAGVHRGPWPPATSHCWSGKERENKNHLNHALSAASLPITSRHLRQIVLG